MRLLLLDPKDLFFSLLSQDGSLHPFPALLTIDLRYAVFKVRL